MSWTSDEKRTDMLGRTGAMFRISIFRIYVTNDEAYNLSPVLLYIHDTEALGDRRVYI